MVCEETNQALDAIGVYARFCSAESNAVEIGGRVGRLPFGIDRHIGIRERNAMESPTGEPIRPILRIQPRDEPLHLPRQIELVHDARQCRLQSEGTRECWEAPARTPHTLRRVDWDTRAHQYRAGAAQYTSLSLDI